METKGLKVGVAYNANGPAGYGIWATNPHMAWVWMKNEYEFDDTAVFEIDDRRQFIRPPAYQTIQRIWRKKYP